MSLPLTDDLGVVQVAVNGTPVYWNAGLGYDENGNLCTTTTVSATDAYIGGKRRDAVGRLVVADPSIGGTPYNFNAGWPMDKNTGATIRQMAQVPLDSDPRVAGIAIGPRGGVYMAVGGAGAFSPADLFANGEKGFWYDPSDLSTMFQDSLGTIPMSAVGTVADQPVGKILDKSGNDNHAPMATSTARPVLSARVNWLTKTEDFADAYWYKDGITYAQNAIAPDNTTTAWTLTTTTSTDTKILQSGATVGGINVLSVYAKAGSASYIGLSKVTSSLEAVVNLTTGAVESSAGCTPVVETAANGFYRITLALPTETSLYLDIKVGETAGQAVSGVTYAGTGKTILVWHPQVETGRGQSTTYQRVNTEADYDASGFPIYLKFDGVDDSLATASFAMTSTSKATVFAGYANGKTGSTGTLLEFSANYMNNNGSMALLVPSLSTSNVSFGSRGTLGAGEKDSPTAPVGGLEKRVLTAYQDFGTVGDYGCDFIRAQGIPLQNLIGVGNSAVGAGPFGTFPAYIGSRAGTANSMNGQIYSLILAGNGYDAQTIENTENWVDSKLHP